MSAQKIIVSDTRDMGPLLKRVTFTGNDGAFDEMADGLHIKLFFKREHQTDLNLPYRQNGKIIWPESDKKPYARTYSVAGFCPHRNLLEVDFVMHEEAGPASAFAADARKGDVIGVAGPGPMQLVCPYAKSYLFIGDLSALPALSAVFQNIPYDRKLLLLEAPTIEIGEETLQYYLPDYEHHIQVFEQKHRPEETLKPALERILSAVDISKWSITLAGEHRTVTCLKSLLLENGVPKNNLYAVPYWRHRMAEEAYHEMRHKVMDA